MMVLLYVALAAVQAACGSPAVPSTLERAVARDSQFGVSFTSDRLEYAPGDTAAVTFRVFNRTGASVVVRFSTGQRYDVVLEGEEGGGVQWRWSDGRGFIQMLGEEVLGPSREELVYEISVPLPATAGRYRVRGLLTSTSHPLTASLTVVIGP